MNASTYAKIAARKDVSELALHGYRIATPKTAKAARAMVRAADACFVKTVLFEGMDPAPVPVSKSALLNLIAAYAGFFGDDDECEIKLYDDGELIVY